MTAARIPDWVTFPEDDWVQITPQEAGLDPKGFGEFLAGLDVQGNDFGGEVHEGNDWGCVITRGGYLVHMWGDGDYRFQTASMGKSFIFALLGLAAQEGLLDPDQPINRAWTGEGELSHPHKHLDRGRHKGLTWRHLAGRKHVQGHFGGFPIEVGYHWKMGPEQVPERWAATIPEWADWTGDPFYDNYAHMEPGTREHYSSGGFWRLSQPLTYIWDRDLKDVMDERIMSKIGIPADRWDWLTGRDVQQDADFYPLMPNAWDYLDPPYEINGHPVRSGPGWVVISAKDLARFGLLVATEGNWRGEQLLDPQWVRGHGGGNGSGQSGESTHYTSMGMVTTRGIDYRFTIATESFVPREIFTGPVKVTRTV